MDPQTQHELVAVLAEIDAELEQMKWDLEKLKTRIHDMEKKIIYSVGEKGGA